MTNFKKQVEDLPTFNIITLGDSTVGKTSIINRYIQNIFMENTVATCGFFKSAKEIVLKNNKKIKLNLCDTAGQEKYRSLNTQYVKNVDVVLFIFDLSNKKTFKNIKEWIEFFNTNNRSEKKSQQNIPRYLIGNKKDLERDIEKEEIDFFLAEKENKNMIYKETSAKENNDEINNIFQEIGEKLYIDYIKSGKKNKKNKKENVQLSKYTEKKKHKFLKCIV